MKKILYCILLMFLCSLQSCDRRKQSREQDQKDSLAVANLMKCATFLYHNLLLHSDSNEQEEHTTFPVFKSLCPLENDLIDTVCAIWLSDIAEDSCVQHLVANKDSQDIIITALLEKYMETKQMQLPRNPVDRYKCIDSIITSNLIPNTDQEEEYGDQMQINSSLGIAEIWTEYLSCHYDKSLKQVLEIKNHSLPVGMERDAFERLLKAQINYFDSMRYYEGSASPMKYSQLCNEMYATRLKGTLDMYFSLQVKNYKPDKVYRPITNKIIAKEYNTIIHAIDNLKYYEYLDSSTRQKGKMALLNEQKAWNDLMKARLNISRKLQGRIKFVYDNATYRLQRYHLIQLKNAFKGYGAMSNDVYSCLLSDTCNYNELLNAPNFFVKWDLRN